MNVVKIPDEHHVVRYCKKRLLIRDEGEIIGVFPELFHLRPASPTREQEKYLSAVYYEYFNGSSALQMAKCRDALPLTPKPKDALVRLSALSVREQGKKRKLSLRVTHEAKRRAAAYAAIRGIPIVPDQQLSGLLANFAVVEVIEVSSI